GLDHVVAGGQSMDHLHVGLHAEQGGEGIPHHALILREQDPDRIGHARPLAFAFRGTLATKRNPPPASRPASRCPPTERTRSARPASPLPGSVSGRHIHSDGVPLPPPP